MSESIQSQYIKICIVDSEAKRFITLSKKWWENCWKEGEFESNV